MTNSGLDLVDVDEKVREIGERGFKTGYDVKKQEIVDMYKSGVIDPAKVTKNAFSNAMSVAQIVLQTNCIITNKRENKS
jgi:chaperonin GroEL